MKQDTTQNASSVGTLASSPIGRKVLTGITGLGWVAFVIVHVTGNLSYFSSSDAYNAYAHFLMSLGPILYILELGLLAFLIIHAVLGVQIYLGKRRARGGTYARYRSRGAPSMQSVSSRSMIVTGLILLGFLVIHIFSFKYGTYYETTVDGVVMRDLARLLTEKFQSPFYTFGYVAVMLLLAVHLRHGIWSALQSLGAMTPRLTPLIYGIGGLLAILIAVGFIVLPLWIYFTGGNA